MTRSHQKKRTNKTKGSRWQTVRVERCWPAWLARHDDVIAILTLQYPHEESGEGHEGQGVRAQVGQDGGRGSDDRPRSSRNEQDALPSKSAETRPTEHAEPGTWRLNPGLKVEVCGSPVTRMSSQDLSEAVAPEKSSQNYPRVNFTPAERLCHGHHADGHGHPRAVEQAGAQEQHHAPFFSQGPKRLGGKKLHRHRGSLSNILKALERRVFGAAPPQAPPIPGWRSSFPAHSAAADGDGGGGDRRMPLHPPRLIYPLPQLTGDKH